METISIDSLFVGVCAYCLCIIEISLSEIYRIDMDSEQTHFLSFVFFYKLCHVPFLFCCSPFFTELNQ